MHFIIEGSTLTFGNYALKNRDIKEKVEIAFININNN